MSRKFVGKKMLVFAQSGVGGAERMSVTITKSLDRDKFKVQYYLVGDFEDERAPLKQFIPDDLSVHCIGSCSSILLILKFFFILAKEKPDVVFASVLNINNKLLLLRKLFRHVKFVIRCDNYLYTYNDKQRRIILKTYPNADIIIAQTDEMKNELVDEFGFDEHKIKVLQNPVDAETIKKRVQDGTNPYPIDKKVRYVASGRFAIQKGFDLLVKAFFEVKNKQPNAELYIIGNKTGVFDEYYQKVEQIIEEYGLKNAVFCPGFQSNPYVYVKYADCFVLSSRWEGLPNVMIEALYLGTPVAAFKCIPIIERIISDGVDGCLAEKDNISSLANAMLQASRLGRVKTNYKSAQISDFHAIFKHLVKKTMNKKSQIFNFLYRHAHYGGMIWNVFYKLYTQYLLGCDIPSSTLIGDNFEIFHSAHGAVISPGTIIGNNVSLRQNTTIGAKGFNGAKDSPIIEDNVTIGPNVCIIGDITIGKGAVIGAGAVVVKDVPPSSTVVGNPAKILGGVKDIDLNT